MRHTASLSAPTSAERRSALSWRGSAFGSGQQNKCLSIVLNHEKRPCGWRSTRACVVAGISTNAPAFATSTAAGREQACALPPSQLADELYHYASSAVAAGCRPGNDPFLASCLTELAPPHRLRRLHPRQLASVLRSLVHLGANPGEDWLSDLDACCYCHPGPFDPASATAVLQALAALHTAPTAAAPAAPPNPSATYVSAHHSSPQTSVAKAQQRYLDQQRGGKQQQRQRQQRRLGLWREVGSAPSGTPSATPTAAASPAPGSQPAPFRFPHAVYLRLLQGGVYNYSYEQLATLLQAFRSLGVPVSDELALQVGSRMAAQLLEMVPEQRQLALAAVLGGGGGGGAYGGAYGYGP